MTAQLLLPAPETAPATRWWNDYVGIPYLAGGRDRAGLDCWGLVRLVHAEQWGQELPSFAGDYAGAADPAVDELMAREREGWRPVEQPAPGDLVLFRILGREWHVGLCTEPGRFLHARQGLDAVCIERLDSGGWRHRLRGVYRWAPHSLAVSARAHPLRTERIDATLPAGMTLAGMVEAVQASQGVPAQLRESGVLLLDGRPVPPELWATTRPGPGARVEYRALPRGNAMRMVLSIVIAVAAWYVAPMAMGFAGGSAGWTAAAAAGSMMSVSATAMALNMAGSLLVNAIAPIRLPNIGNPGSADAQKLLQGGSNRPAPYEAIPVVLGCYRYTAPVGAQTFVESDASTSYLRMLLVWGYGPLQISDMRIGTTPIDTLEETELETLTGWADTPVDRTSFDRIYGQDVTQQSPGIELTSDGTDAGSPWVEHVLDEPCDSIKLTLHFPQGLRALQVEGENAGDELAATFRGEFQVRRLNDLTLQPLTDWQDVLSSFAPAVHELGTAYSTSGGTAGNQAQTVARYRWTRLSINASGRLVARVGDIWSAAEGGSFAGGLGGILGTYGAAGRAPQRLPDYGVGEEPLWDICVHGDVVHRIDDKRGAAVTGCAVTHAGLRVSIAAGAVLRAQGEPIALGAQGEPFYKRKDAFSHNATVNVARGRYEVRVRRRNTSEDEGKRWGTEGPKTSLFHAAYLANVTGYRNAKPVSAPPGVTLAMTALRIKATDQVNGTIDGISATLHSICPDWDAAAGAWITRPSRNPASLLRYVLQHPGNAQRVPDSRIDLADLADWHDYCRIHGWAFDAVLSGQRSLLDVLRDIAAAGRASPTMRDGKWTVIIDRPRTAIAQHFTPHNSWGFEGVRTLPRLPHAFRVEFVNSERSFEPDERIVYNDGYSAANATLFERLELPGVTTPAAVHQHARFHLAQLKLRPETYTLNADIEHIVCTRGNLVRVTHDVPMWGLGTGRIRARVSATVVEMDEEMPMDAGKPYTLRIRRADGASVTRTVAAVAVDGHYRQLTLTAAVTAADAEPGNLVMFGALNAESVELVVLAIEPAANKSARITLVDYAPAVYDSDTEAIPTFDSQITLPPRLLIPTITQRPTITRIVSDESVMQLLAPGRYGYQIRAVYTRPAGLPVAVSHVEAQIDYAGDASLQWSAGRLFPLATGSVTFQDVVQGEAYRIRLRYVDGAGRTGPWTETATHTVVGKSSKPSTPTSLTLAVEGTRLRARWTPAPEIDVVEHEVRDTDSGWGTAGWAWRGGADTCVLTPGPIGVVRTWYVRAVDAAGNYSTASAAVSYTTAAPADPATITETWADTALTAATLTLDWPDVAPPFGLDAYRVSYGSVVKTVKASTITLPADWIGERVFTVQTVDALGSVSPGRTRTLTKRRPDPVTGVRAQVIDNNVLLYWSLPARTTLPVSHARLRVGATWDTAADIGSKAGSFTTVSELQRGAYTYWLAAVDTDGWESDPVSVQVQVSEPPDYVYRGTLTSVLGGTLSAALLDGGAVMLPVDTTETWAGHFTSRGWSSPADQVAASYPHFLQPTPASGYYQEVFDYGTVLPSSNVTVAWSGAAVAGSPSVALRIELSDDGGTWQSAVSGTTVFGTNFRYVRVRLTVSGDAAALYRLTGLSVRLDAKVKTAQGKATAAAADAKGTVVNFGVQLLDVQSITVTPGGTAARSVVYDFQDAVLTGTYTVTGGVATINVAGHDLVVGQQVRLNFTTGAAASVTAAVASVPGTGQFTAAVASANTSGAVQIYPQGMRVYLFDAAGARASGPISWAIKGY